MFVKLQKLAWVVENHKINYFLKEVFLNKNHVLYVSEFNRSVRPDLEGTFGAQEFSDITILSSNKENVITVLGAPDYIIDIVNKQKRLLYD